MSGIFLNYDDVRRLTKILGRHRPTDDSLSCIRLIAAGLGTTIGLLHNKLQGDGASSDVGINMTEAHYRDLCVTIRSHDLTAMRSTDRLEAIARSLGWRADALMHHLKSTTVDMGSNPSLRLDIDFVGDFAQFTAADQSERWRSMLSDGPGLFVVTGLPGDGVARAMISSVMILDNNAKVGEENNLIGHRESDGQMVYGLSIRTREDLRQCVDLASTSTVVASHVGNGIDETKARLSELGDAEGITLSCLKGVLHRSIHNRHDPTARLEVSIYSPGF